MKSLFAKVSMAAAVIIVGFCVAYAGVILHSKYKASRPTYYKEFSAMVITVHNDNVTLVGDCQSVRASFKVKEKAVILSVNDVIMTGTPVGITEDSMLIVEFDGGRRLGFVRIKADDSHTDEFLIMLAPDYQTIFTSNTDCEEITRFLDKTVH